MDENKITTKRMPAIQNEVDEKQFVEKEYSEAWKALFADPDNKEKLERFERANAALWETRDAYRSAQKLLLERREKLRQATIDAQIFKNVRQQIRRSGKTIHFINPQE